MGTFNDALEILKNNGKTRRKVIHGSTVIVNYKNRLYWMSVDTGVRYPYRPTNADLMADDWVGIITGKHNELLDENKKAHEKFPDDFIKKQDSSERNTSIVNDFLKAYEDVTGKNIEEDEFLSFLGSNDNKVFDKIFNKDNERTFKESEIAQLQSKVYAITGDGEVMQAFNKLLGINAT